MLWAIQKNIIRPDRCLGVSNACKQLDIPFTTFRSYPDNDPNHRGESSEHYKSPKIPDYDGAAIFIGATFVVDRVYQEGYWSPGVYFNPDQFRFASYKKYYQEHMLNGDCQFMTMRELRESSYGDKETFFIRPDKDLKEFTGMVVELEDIRQWDPESTKQADKASLDTEIIVAKPVDIEKEWRLIIVNEKFSSGSQYSEHGELSEDPNVPQEVIEFAEEMSRIWTPDQVFSMDIAKANGSLKVIECNCFNCSGFYSADISKIVKDVNDAY